MNRRKLTLVTAMLAALSFGVIAEEKKPKPKKQTICPVMRSQPIAKDKYIDVKGKRVYVCCSGCISQVKANPDKYIKRLEDQGYVFEKAPTADSEKKAELKPQTTCPVMGGKINKAQYVDVKGNRIYVCCLGCVNTIKADPDKYIEKMKAKGIMLEKTPKKDPHAGHQH